ncbi:MAG TPA: DUF2950 domain-containing protein [Casimicrobiaceae bacterium]|nr:DUF2950 domain-containing protein [Casimicrobiaceae bacterium]
MKSRTPGMMFMIELSMGRLATAVAFAAGMALAGGAVAAGAKAYPTPDALFQAVADAAKADDAKALGELFGPDGSRIANSGDPVRDRNARERFAAAYAQKHTVNRSGDARAELVVGNDDWPFPIPAVKGAVGWSLDSAAGAREIVARRIGENEIDAINAIRAIADAQFDYASEPRNGKFTQYARKFLSGPGHHDGLYWQTKAGEPDSPLGPLAARATQEGYGKNTPYHGYRFRILTEQGPNAKGGARKYIVRGQMIGGFGVLAYPAVYEDTGIMTFIINQDGVVYQKDIGRHTGELAPKIKLFDPDSTWTQVKP